MNRLASTLFLTLVSATPFATALANDDTALLAYAAPDGEWIRLDNGVVLEGSDLSSLDTNTTGFRLTAGFSPEDSASPSFIHWCLPAVHTGGRAAGEPSTAVKRARRPRACRRESQLHRLTAYQAN